MTAPALNENPAGASSPPLAVPPADVWDAIRPCILRYLECKPLTPPLTLEQLRNTDVYLVDEGSGKKITLITEAKQEKLPPRSRARQVRQGGAYPPSRTRLAEGRTNSVVFPNTEKILHVGSKVAVVMGGMRVDNVLVQ